MFATIYEVFYKSSLK